MMQTSTLRPALPVILVLLAACGSDRTAEPLRARSTVVTERDEATSDPAVRAASGTAPAEAAATRAGSADPQAAAAPVEPAPDEATDASIGIVAATFTHGVEARRPVDEARAFTVGERATLHLVVKNLGAPRDVTVEWRRGETVLGYMTLPIGTSPSWRTWATRRVGSRDVEAGVQVRVLDAEGNVLHDGHASVTDGSTPAA